MHIGSVIYTGILVIVLAALDQFPLSELWPFILIGLLGCGGYMAFFKALNLGPVTIVSPIVSGYTVITVILAVIILAERPGPLQTLAIVIVFVGVGLASTELRTLKGAGGGFSLSRGIVLAIIAMFLIGGYVFSIAYFTEPYGWLVPIFLVRVFSTGFFLGGSAVMRYPLLANVTWPLAIAMLLIGVVETSAYISFSFGVAIADTSLVATIASGYALVPIVLGFIFLGERPALNQWVGIAMVIFGLILLGSTA
jgi:drug/metabolite transporter (DMT)-like permease